MHVALIGASGFGRNHLRGLQASPHVETISLGGRNLAVLEALRAEFPKVVRATTDLEELFGDPGVDAVDLVVPHDQHLPLGLRALESGKHLILEKPPARTVEEFKQLLTAANRQQRRVFVVLNLLFSAFHRAVRQAVDAGLIGRPFLALEVATPNALSLYEDAADWRADRERCGGGLQIDGGFHAVYRMLYFLQSLGFPRWVTADCAQIGVEAATKGEDFSAMTLAYACGARIHLMNQWTARAGLGRFPSGILGTEGTLLFTGDPERPLVLRRPGADDEALTVAPGPEGFADTAAACIEHYLECLTTRAEPYGGTDLALRTLEVITGAYRSGAEGRRWELRS